MSPASGPAKMPEPSFRYGEDLVHCALCTDDIKRTTEENNVHIRTVHLMKANIGSETAPLVRYRNPAGLFTCECGESFSDSDALPRHVFTSCSYRGPRYPTPRALNPVSAPQQHLSQLPTLRAPPPTSLQHPAPAPSPATSQQRVPSGGSQPAAQWMPTTLAASLNKGQSQGASHGLLQTGHAQLGYGRSSSDSQGPGPHMQRSNSNTSVSSQQTVPHLDVFPPQRHFGGQQQIPFNSSYISYQAPHPQASVAPPFHASYLPPHAQHGMIHSGQGVPQRSVSASSSRSADQSQLAQISRPSSREGVASSQLHRRTSGGQSAPSTQQQPNQPHRPTPPQVQAPLPPSSQAGPHLPQNPQQLVNSPHQEFLVQQQHLAERYHLQEQKRHSQQQTQHEQQQKQQQQQRLPPPPSQQQQQQPPAFPPRRSTPSQPLAHSQKDFFPARVTAPRPSILPQANAVAGPSHSRLPPKASDAPTPQEFARAMQMHLVHLLRQGRSMVGHGQSYGNLQAHSIPGAALIGESSRTCAACNSIRLTAAQMSPQEQDTLWRSHYGIQHWSRCGIVLASNDGRSSVPMFSADRASDGSWVCPVCSASLGADARQISAHLQSECPPFRQAVLAEIETGQASSAGPPPGATPAQPVDQTEISLLLASRADRSRPSAVETPHSEHSSAHAPPNAQPAAPVARPQTTTLAPVPEVKPSSPASRPPLAHDTQPRSLPPPGSSEASLLAPPPASTAATPASTAPPLTTLSAQPRLTSEVVKSAAENFHFFADLFLPLLHTDTPVDRRLLFLIPPRIAQTRELHSRLHSAICIILNKVLAGQAGTYWTAEHSERLMRLKRATALDDSLRIIGEREAAFRLHHIVTLLLEYPTHLKETAQYISRWFPVPPLDTRPSPNCFLAWSLYRTVFAFVEERRHQLSVEQLQDALVAARLRVPRGGHKPYIVSPVKWHKIGRGFIKWAEDVWRCWGAFDELLRSKELLPLEVEGDLDSFRQDVLRILQQISVAKASADHTSDVPAPPPTAAAVPKPQQSQLPAPLPTTATATMPTPAFSSPARTSPAPRGASGALTVIRQGTAANTITQLPADGPAPSTLTHHTAAPLRTSSPPAHPQPLPRLSPSRPPSASTIDLTSSSPAAAAAPRRTPQEPSSGDVSSMIAPARSTTPPPQPSSTAAQPVAAMATAAPAPSTRSHAPVAAAADADLPVAGWNAPARSATPPPQPSSAVAQPVAAMATAAPPPSTGFQVPVVGAADADLPVTGWKPRPYAVRQDSPVKGIILRDSTVRPVPSLNETLEAARHLRSEQDEVPLASSTPVANVPTAQERAPSSLPVAVSDQALIQKRMPEAPAQPERVASPPPAPPLVPAAGEILGTSSDLNPPPNTSTDPVPSPSLKQPTPAPLEQFTSPSLEQTNSAREAQEVPIDPSLEPASVPAPPAASQAQALRASLPTPPKSPPTTVKVRVKQELAADPEPLPFAPPAPSTNGPGLVKAEPGAAEAPSSPPVTRPRREVPPPRKAAAPTPVEEPELSFDEGDLAEAAYSCLNCDPPVHLATVSERHMHQRRLHQPEMHLRQPNGLVHTIVRADDGLFHCPGCTDYQPTPDPVVLRKHVLAKDHFPRLAQENAQDAAAASSLNDGQEKRKRRDLRGSTSLAPSQSDPGPSTSRASIDGRSSTPKATPSIRQAPRTSLLAAASSPRQPARKKPRLSQLSSAASPAPSASSTSGTPRKRPAAKLPAKIKKRPRSESPEERRWKPSIVPISNEPDDNSDDDVIIM